MELAKLLLDNEANVNCEDINKRTPLHYACIIGNLEMAQLLLQYGANINSQGSSKETPFHLATTLGKTNIAKLLLKNGCDISIKNGNDKTAEDLANLKGHHEIMELILRRRIALLPLNQNRQLQGNVKDCRICFEAFNEHFVFLPCGHVVACEKCCLTVVGNSYS